MEPGRWRRISPPRIDFLLHFRIHGLIGAVRAALKTPNASVLSRYFLSWRSPATRIACFYALVSGIWIITSDRVAHVVAPDQETLEWISVIKGWAFVAVTAVMLWALVQRLLMQVAESEADLRESEEQTRTIYDGVNEAIFIHDAQTGAIVDVNHTACRMFGWTREEFQKLRVEDMSSGVEPYTQENAMKMMTRGISDSGFTFEWHARKSDGRLFWTEGSARPITIGRQARLIVTARDITKRKDATDRVRKLSRAVEQSPVSIIITNPAGRIEYVNPAACRLTGYTVGELNGENPRLLKSGHTPREEYRRLWETIVNGGEWHGEFRNRKKNGDLYWESTAISPITDDAGKITHFLAVKEDITERKAAEEKLMRQEALLQEAGEIAHVGGWEFDPVTSAGSWSNEVARIHDLDPGFRINPEIGLTFYPGESKERIKAAIEAAARDGTPYDLELEFVSATGREKWVRTIGRPIMENGRVIRVRGSLQDITERKQAEHELRESKVRLRALLGRLQNTREQERTRLSREVHDVLGQLLTGMKMDLSWLERRLFRIEDEELRATVSGKIAGTTALTDLMLESVQKISRDLRPSLLDNLGLPTALQSEARQFSERTGIACEIVNLPAPDDLSADCATTVFRIFQEILTNIARHSRASQVRISLSRGAEGVKLEVEDNGCGISPEALKNPDSLGLLGMSERAELLGGRLEIHGTPGEGTRVTLTIPDEVA
jgi:PAS domain S-box-containing protein